jgi:hypothetical protein
MQVGFEPTTTCLAYRRSTNELLRTYHDVLSQLLHILLDTEYNTPHAFLLAGYSTILQVSGHPFNSCTATGLSARTVRLSNYQLVFSIQQFGMLQFSHHSLLELTDWLCSYPFGLQHCLTTYRLATDGTCFRISPSQV